ncbi:hypothetical protein Scep_013171 [Stephania cephalantha]|uniref:Uncharacterized protein n=1 Tax=Stephania cephalantha TaxID=152367 RepID=A0AAP0P7D4_9MAGN
MGRSVFVLVVLMGLVVVMGSSSSSSASSVEGHSGSEEANNYRGEANAVAEAPVNWRSGEEESEESMSSDAAAAPEIRRLGQHQHQHHHSDKSIAGGEVIIGGLATAIFAAVFCYIRVTRKQNADRGTANV